MGSIGVGKLAMLEEVARGAVMTISEYFDDLPAEEPALSWLAGNVSIVARCR